MVTEQVGVQFSQYRIPGTTDVLLNMDRAKSKIIHLVPLDGIYSLTYILPVGFTTYLCNGIM